MKDLVGTILNNYRHEPPGVQQQLWRLLNHGRLGGTGKMLILPVDQGLEHGPARSFEPNPGGYDPLHHVELAMAAGCNAHATTPGAIMRCVDRYPIEMPYIYKMNSSTVLYSDKAGPMPAWTGTVREAFE